MWSRRRRTRPRARRWIAVAAPLLLATLLSGCSPGESSEVVYLDPVRTQAGDDPRWAEPGWDDAGWPEMPFFRLPEVEGIRWVRSELELEAPFLERTRPVGLVMAGMFTCEVFWDGTRLEAEGRPGATAAEERPAPIQQVVLVPESLVGAGSHVVALRCSAHHRGFEPSAGWWFAAVGPYDGLLRLPLLRAWSATASLSGMVLGGLFFLFLFALDRSRAPDLWLGLLSLTGGALLVAESWRDLVGYTYDWHLFRLRLVTVLAGAVSLLLVIFLTRRFPGRGGGWLVAVTGVAVVLPWFVFQAWDPRSIAALLVAMTLGLGWCLVPARRGLAGARLAATGVGICLAILLAAPTQVLGSRLFLGLDLLLLCLLAAHALSAQRARRDREAARLQAARLEAELLRRHLQPHFLMNTLTALADWIEEDPAIAVRMIEALAEELRVLDRISVRRAVPMAEELALCRSHLQVMDLRRDCRYRLEAEGVDGAALVPPAVFHTLVENAVTHNPCASGEEVVLRLSESREGERRRYRFESPSTRAAGADGPPGTGLQYVESRLRELWGDAALLSHGPVSSGAVGSLWVTEIEVPAKAPDGEPASRDNGR